MPPPTPLPFALDTLAEAHEYQRWVFDAARPFLGRRILEVGSGIGNMSQWLPADDLLVLTDTDPELVALLRKRVPAYFGQRAANVRDRKSTRLNSSHVRISY